MTQAEVELKLAELEEWLSLITAQKYPGATTLEDFKRERAAFARFRSSYEAAEKESRNQPSEI